MTSPFSLTVEEQKMLEKDYKKPKSGKKSANPDKVRRPNRVLKLNQEKCLYLKEIRAERNNNIALKES